MNMFKTFDSWLIGALEKFCNKIQKVFGVTCCYLCGFVEFFSVLCFLDSRSNIVFSKESVQAGIFGTMCRDAPVLFWMMIVIGLADSLFVFEREKRALGRLKKGLANPSKNNPLRILTRVLYELIFVFFLFVHILSGRVVVYDVLIVSMIVLGLLLEACDPLPPSESKIKVWLKNIKKFRLRILAPTHAK
jgi:hypothetical protein